MGNAPDLDQEERDLHAGLELESRLRQAGPVLPLEEGKAELHCLILLHRLRRRTEIALAVFYVRVDSSVEMVDSQARTPRRCWAHWPELRSRFGDD